MRLAKLALGLTLTLPRKSLKDHLRCAVTTGYSRDPNAALFPPVGANSSESSMLGQDPHYRTFIPCHFYQCPSQKSLLVWLVKFSPFPQAQNRVDGNGDPIDKERRNQ